MTETLGDGGVITGGSPPRARPRAAVRRRARPRPTAFGQLQRHVFGSGGATDTDAGSDSGSDTITETDTAPSTLIETVSETLGADGTVASGYESDSLSEASGAHHDRDRSSDRDGHRLGLGRDDDPDRDQHDHRHDNEMRPGLGGARPWAPARRSPAARIASPSTTWIHPSYVSSGSGPENYNDTAGPRMAATVTRGSGSSSNIVNQIFGDILGTGGAIASGSLSYTVTRPIPTPTKTIESDRDRRRRADRRDEPDRLVHRQHDDDRRMIPPTRRGPRPWAGEADLRRHRLFTWSDADSLNRGLTVNGIAAILSVTENSTDTYGFGESGTERSRPAAPAPGLRLRLEPDGDGHTRSSRPTPGQHHTPGEEATSSYSLDLTDSIEPSSWHDNGADVLTSSDLLSGETDTYTWDHLNSVTDTYWDSDSFSEAGTISGGTWVTANYQNPTGNGGSCSTRRTAVARP